jgi:hypothetical protein
MHPATPGTPARTEPVFFGLSAGPFRPGAFFKAGVGEGWLAFAHACAEAHLAGSFLRRSRTKSSSLYLSSFRLFGGMQPPHGRAWILMTAPIGSIGV